MNEIHGSELRRRSAQVVYTIHSRCAPKKYTGHIRTFKYIYNIFLNILNKFFQIIRLINNGYGYYLLIFTSTGAYCTSWTTNIGDSQIHSFASSESREFAPGCSSGHPVAPRLESSIPRSFRTISTPAEVVQQWNHLASAPQGPVGESLTVATSQCYLPTIEEVMKAVMAVRLANVGSTCYINSVILAQVWSCTMSPTFNTAIYGNSNFCACL